MHRLRQVKTTEEVDLLRRLSRISDTAIGAAFDAAGGADLCLVVGTSALVHPAASVPEATLRNGGSVIAVNLEPTLVECSHCGELKRPHHICPACGHYKGREIVEVSGSA